MREFALIYFNSPFLDLKNVSIFIPICRKHKTAWWELAQLNPVRSYVVTLPDMTLDIVSKLSWSRVHERTNSNLHQRRTKGGASCFCREKIFNWFKFTHIYMLNTDRINLDGAIRAKRRGRLSEYVLVLQGYTRPRTTARSRETHRKAKFWVSDHPAYSLDLP